MSGRAESDGARLARQSTYCTVLVFIDTSCDTRPDTLLHSAVLGFIVSSSQHEQATAAAVVKFPRLPGWQNATLIQAVQGTFPNPVLHFGLGWVP